MALRTADEYRASLQDGRRVYFRGKPVADVTTHPFTKVAVDHAALDYELANDPEHRDLAVFEEDGRVFSRYYQIPTSADDLLKRSELIEAATAAGATLVLLIKEIGTDALNALQIVAGEVDSRAGTEYLPRVRSYYRHCRDNDLALCVAQTDVKGDRSQGPAGQSHPDYYLRIIDRRSDGIVVRGAKSHTSVSVNANEMIVLPTRALSEADADYAVSFAIPIDTPGLKLVASGYGAPVDNTFERPISSRHRMIETLTIFEDVFIPWERVFLAGEWQAAGLLALTFVEFHRFTAVSYKLPLVDALAGAAYQIAEFNGIGRAGHVREKLTWLGAYSETLRALIRQAAIGFTTKPPGIAVPDPLLTNIAKWHFAGGYHQAIKHVQDLAGGLLVTGPSSEDLDNPETAGHIERYLAGKDVSAKDRLRMLNLIQDLTVGDFGGYQQVLAVHAEGSLEAEKLAIFRSYDPRPAISYARRLAGLE